MHSREHKLLVACARSVAGGHGRTDAVALAHRPLDWGYVLDCAALNGMGPLLYSLLRNADGTVPPDAMEALRSAYYASGLRNSVWLATLERMLGAFRARSIDAVLLKGAALGESRWGNVALRPMADMDLLLRDADLDRAQALLPSLGFALREGRSREWYRRHHHHDAPWVHSASGAMVELHRDLVQPGYGVGIDLDGVWRRAVPARVGRVPALALAPEDAVAHICLHTAGADPLVGCVRSLMDLALLLRAGDIDWDAFAGRAEAGEWAGHAAVTLSVARRLSGAAVPCGVVDDLYRRSRLPRVSASVLERLGLWRGMRRPRGRVLVPDWVLVAAGEELFRPGGRLSGVPDAVRRAAERPTWGAPASTRGGRPGHCGAAWRLALLGCALLGPVVPRRPRGRQSHEGSPPA